MTYDRHTRGRVLQEVQRIGRRRGQQAVHRVAHRLSYGKSTIYRWFNLATETGGNFGPFRHRHRQAWASIPPEHTQLAINRLLEECPLLFMKEVVEFLYHAVHIRYEERAVRKALKAAGMSRRKLEYRAREQSEPLRNLYTATINLPMFSARHFVFFDETSCKPLDFRRLYGYGLYGAPAFLYVNNRAHGRGPTVTGLSAIGLDGCLGGFAVKEGPVTAAYVLEVLEVEILSRMNPFPQPHSVLIMDNASVHDHDLVQRLAARYGVLVVFLPPYSYDFNPIEFSFHQVKEFLRGQFGLNEDGLVAEHLAEGLMQTTVENTINYYQHCGIRVTEEDKAWARMVAAVN